MKEVPYLSFPAFRLQETLRLYTLGIGTWASIEKRLRRRQHEVEVREEERTKREVKLQEQIWKFQEKLKPMALNDSARSFNVKHKHQTQPRKIKRSATAHIFG